MTRFVQVAGALSLLALASSSSGCRATKTRAESGAGLNGDTAATRGGSLVASIRTEPRSFNRYAAADFGSDFVSTLTQSKLVRINRATQQVEPWLAERWTASDDGRRVTMALRPGVLFSDGQPLTADDVAFSFRAVYDERTGSPLSDALQVDGKKLTVVAADPHTVVITFPAPYAPGVRILDNLPILPRHKLEALLNAGTFGKAWNLATPPADLAGLGPFVLAQYVPGQRLVFDRNPHYFRKAPDGTALPYLDRLTLEITPDPNSEILRIEAGQIDTMTNELTSDSYTTIKRAADRGRVKLFDLGVGTNADALWFNLKPGAFTGDPRAAWLQRDELRRAISQAVDRKVFADTVFLGAAVPIEGPETPANTQWFWAHAPTPHDPSAAQQVLASIGLTDRNGDGLLEDAKGRPAQFTLLTQKGRPNLERGANVIREELKKIGLTVDVVTLDGGALIERFAGASPNYDAVYFTVSKTDTDPAVNLDFWVSRGGNHPWNLNQKSPATEWERAIDALMARQVASADPGERKRLYDEVQQIFAAHLPMVFFVAPRIYAVSSSRVTHVTPAVLRPQLLWAPESVAVIH